MAQRTRPRPTTPLGRTLDPRGGVAGAGRPDTRARILAALAGCPLTLSELGNGRLHSTVNQYSLHLNIARLRDAGLVTVRTERRFKSGIPRTIVALADPPRDPAAD